MVQKTSGIMAHSSRKPKDDRDKGTLPSLYLPLIEAAKARSKRGVIHNNSKGVRIRVAATSPISRGTVVPLK